MKLRLSLARRHERGLVSTSASALLSAGAVLLAAALYFVTAPSDRAHISLDIVEPGYEEPAVETPTDEAEPGTTGGDDTPAQPTATVDRSSTAVVVLNNSKVSGLAARTAVSLQTLGWDVEDSANWVGVDQPSSVVFYPEGEADAAGVLAGDLHISRVEPMPSTMPEKRITVVLTSE